MRPAAGQECKNTRAVTRTSFDPVCLEPGLASGQPVELEFAISAALAYAALCPGLDLSPHESPSLAGRLVFGSPLRDNRAGPVHQPPSPDPWEMASCDGADATMTRIRPSAGLAGKGQSAVQNRCM